MLHLFVHLFSACFSMYRDENVSYNVSIIFTLLLFDEVSKFDIRLVYCPIGSCYPRCVCVCVCISLCKFSHEHICVIISSCLYINYPLSRSLRDFVKLWLLMSEDCRCRRNVKTTNRRNVICLARSCSYQQLTEREIERPMLNIW